MLPALEAAQAAGQPAEPSPAAPPLGSPAVPPGTPPADAEVWGVGRARTLRAYEEFAGGDFGAMKVTAQAECGGMADEGAFWDRFACLHAMLQQAGAEEEE